MATTPLASFQAHFGGIDNPRIGRTKRHQLLDIAALATSQRRRLWAALNRCANRLRRLDGALQGRGKGKYPYALCFSGLPRPHDNGGYGWKKIPFRSWPSSAKELDDVASGAETKL